MIDFFKGRLPKIWGTGTKQNEKGDLTPPASESKVASPPPLPNDIPSIGGLPWDFWPILSKLPYTISSNDLEKIRQTPEYKALLSQYRLAHQGRTKTVKNDSREQPLNTSTESLEVLLQDIKPT